MDYRLLVDLEAIAILDSIPKRARKRLLDHFAQLRASSDRFSDYHEQDRTGRRIEISVFAGYSIHYWIDFADRHVKVLAIKPATDRNETALPCAVNRSGRHGSCFLPPPFPRT